MRIVVMGCGRWGAFLASYAKGLGHEVMLYGRASSRDFMELKQSRENEYMRIPEGIALTCELEEAMAFGQMALVAIGAQSLREFSRSIAALDTRDKDFVLCMKGLENVTGKRLSQVFTEETGLSNRTAVWVGPGHVQDFARGIPNCMVVSSYHVEITRKIVREMTSNLIRFYYSKDIIGVETGAAAKNVIGIAAGMLDGLGYSCLKGALMARGAREISRLVQAMGGEEITVYGLSHLGDYEATLFSSYSRNRQFGEDLALGKGFHHLAEGVETASGLCILSERHGVELPISRSVHEIIHNRKDPKKALVDLFLRPIKYEF
ncbi:MAG: NAD(P)H-dependent glycerol-3-phosphate dehydrogenase [Clostridia bacterium]